jgi:hypothetical protein
MDGDVQAGVADGVARGREAARVAELGEDRDPVSSPMPYCIINAQQPGWRRAGPQLLGDRRRLRVQRVDHLKRDGNLLARHV